MPVREDGRWESWPARKAREDAEAAAKAEETPVEAEPEVIDINQPRRRGSAAAAAAIADATGVEVDLTADPLPEVTGLDGDEQPSDEEKDDLYRVQSGETLAEVITAHERAKENA